jgi:hypothetical protein
MDKIQKVMTGVVGHPVSEKGERGGSPSRRKWERHCTLTGTRDRTRLPLARETALVNPVVSAGLARYRDQVVGEIIFALQAGWYRGGLILRP